MNKEKLLNLLISFYVTAYKQQFNYEGDLPKHLDAGDTPYFYPIYNLVEKEIRNLCGRLSQEEKLFESLNSTDT